MLVWYIVGLVVLSIAPPCQAQKYDDYAKKVAGEPLKLRIRPNSNTVSTGQKVELVVTVLNGEGQAVRTKQKLDVDIRVIEPSGKVHGLSEVISLGQHSDTQTFTPRVPGPHLVEAKDKAGKLLSDKYSFWVVPRLVKKSFGPRLDERMIPSRFFAKPPPPEPQPNPAGPLGAGSKPKLSFEVLARDEGVLADGKDCVTISARYLSEDGQPASTDILVWLRRSHGELDTTGGRLLIPKGEYEARACWTSRWPARDATIEIAEVAPRLILAEPTSSKVQFVRRVHGIVPVGPLSFSLVEKPILRANFVDREGNTMSADKVRSVSFTVKDTRVTVSSGLARVNTDEAAPSVTLNPVSPGASTIQIDSEGLHSAVHTVTVTVGWLVALAMGGGLFGGGLSFLKTRQLAALKLIGGIVGGFVLAAIYVFGAIPIAPVLPLNSISVIAIALIGGWVGTEVLDWTWGSLKKG